MILLPSKIHDVKLFHRLLMNFVPLFCSLTLIFVFWFYINLLVLHSFICLCVSFHFLSKFLWASAALLWLLDFPDLVMSFSVRDKFRALPASAGFWLILVTSHNMFYFSHIRLCSHPALSFVCSFSDPKQQRFTKLYFRTGPATVCSHFTLNKTLICIFLGDNL